jgi:ATP-dependent DNA helicase PIF1
MAKLEDLFPQGEKPAAPTPGQPAPPAAPSPVQQERAFYSKRGDGPPRTLKVPLKVPQQPAELPQTVRQAFWDGLKQAIGAEKAEAQPAAPPPPTPAPPPANPPADFLPSVEDLDSWLQLDALPLVAPATEAPARPPVELEIPIDTLIAGMQPHAYLSGPAGTGKTFLARQLMQSRPDSVLFCATTGIAAVNLGDAITVNGALGFFDTASLMENYAQGHLTYRLRMLRKAGIRIILIDEVSMMPADQLTILVQAIQDIDVSKGYDQDLEQVTYSVDDDGRLRLLLVGDFAQLGPIKADFVFQAPVWNQFTTFKLTQNRRQGDQEFVRALQAVRKGYAAEALPILEPRMVPTLDFGFNGTTIVPKNDAVDRINGLRHAKLPGPLFTWGTIRSGEQMKEWIKQIPEEVQVKKGALVMILANRPYPKLDDDPMVTGYYYVNGDLATVIEKTPLGIRVMLHRTLKEELVVPAVKELKEATGKKKKDERWLIKGTVTYMPLRLAYATTVHKSQGLSLDEVQISMVDGFFSQPGMMYVALSRCRTLEGLRLVGNSKMFLGRCGVDKRIGAYL